MEPAAWNRLRAVVEEALDRPRQEREDFLLGACADDAALLARARELVAHDDDVGGILDESHDPPPLMCVVPVEEPARRAGERLGPWRLERELGRGGMGTVWLASRADDAFAKSVAIKLVRSDRESGALLTRFRREQRLLASLEHPGIARLIDVGRDDQGRPFLVLEHVEGVPIDAWVRERELDLRERLELFLQVCAAVAHAHARLVVHRDLKPSNVLVTLDGQPKLLDFGIAKVLVESARDEPEATATGMLVFTPGYASPEQVRGEPIGTASDVYSLGVLLYELLTGERPYRFETHSPTEVLRVVCEANPPAPSAAARASAQSGRRDGPNWSRQLAGDLDAIVLTALRKEPERRYASVEAFAEDLRRFLDGLPVRARPDTLGYRAAKFLRRNGLPVAAVLGLVLALAAGLVGTTTQFLRAEAGWAAEAEQNRLAQERLDELERLAIALTDEKALAERRFGEVRRFATELVFDLQTEILPLAGATRARERLVRLGLEHLDRLAAEAGDDGELRLELAGAYMQMGDVLGGEIGFHMGRTLEAIEAYERALELARGVEAGATAHSRGRPITADAGRKLADALHAVGRFDREREVLEVALAALEGATEREDAATGDLVSTLATLGRLTKLEMLRGGLDEAEALLARVLSLAERLLVRHGDQASAWVEMGEASRLQAELERLRGDSDAAIAALEAACMHMDEAVARSGGHALVRRYWYQARNDLASELVERGDAEAGLELLEESLEWVVRLAEADPANQQFQNDHATLLRRLGRAYLELGEYTQALEAAARAREVGLGALERQPESVGLRTLCGLARAEQGRAQARLERAADARDAFEQALEELEALHASLSDSAESRRTLTRVHGAVAEETSRLAALERVPAHEREALRSLARSSTERGLQLYGEMRGALHATPADRSSAERLGAVARELGLPTGDDEAP